MLECGMDCCESGKVAIFCEYVHELSGSIKIGKFIQFLNNTASCTSLGYSQD
jgi:hypothetical protein